MGRRANIGIVSALLALATGACDGDPPTPDAGGEPDAGPVTPASIDHCTFEDVPATARAGETVTSGELMAGTAEALLDVPLGASLAAYTSRAEGAGREGFLPEPDARHTYLAGSFAPSVGIETAPRLRALALSAGGETVLLLKVDLATSYQGFVHDVEAALGPEYAGKVMVASSHSHSSFGNYSGHSALAVGFGRWRSTVYDAIIAQLVEVAEAAIAELAPARIGFAYDPDFDLEDRVNRDRRGENDELAGGRFDDHHLFVIRVDAEDGSPMALLPVFGIHGTLGGGNNAFISTDSIGGIERVLEESFDSEVLVMHLQGAGGDVSPAGSGGVDCAGAEVCSDFARAETVGLHAEAEIRAAWEAAGADMQDRVEIEMLTRTVPLGPDWETFRIREGALEYAPFDLSRDADGIVYGADGELVSPIDEFNAPYGAALCSPTRPALIPRAQMPGTNQSEYTYRGCNRLEMVDRVFEISIDVDFEDPPLCETTQTTVSALRIGDWMIGTMPGEPVTLLVEHLRTLSPVPPERTIVVGYAQDHGGYLLTPEDWLSGGYEPEITFWGPLEGEYVAEQVARLFALAATPEREDASAEGLARVASPTLVDGLTGDDAQNVGTIPSTLPAYLLTRLLRTVPSAQPAATVERLAPVFFTWVGDDPLRGTPRTILQREVEGVWEDVTRRSGRVVQEGDLILSWTPDPIEGEDGIERTHYYTVEMQAVAPMGMAGLEGLGDRAGLPVGRYRFRIDAPTYDLTSEPFEVVPTTLREMHTTSGSDLAVTVGVEAPEGYRLLDLEARSNRFVPLRGQPVEVSVGGAAAETLTTSADGSLTVPGGAGAEVVITDRFGNSVTIGP